MKMKTLLGLLAGIFSIVSALHAQVPQLIKYQGRVVVGSTNFHGTGSFKLNGDGTETTGATTVRARPAASLRQRCR